MASSTGSAVVKAWRLPPTMMVRVALAAGSTPPLMGASKKVASRSAASFAICWEVKGPTVLWSTSSCPGCVVASRPFSPWNTCSTAGTSGRQVSTMSQRPATSEGLEAATAPAAAMASTLPRLRLCTTSGKPARSRFRAMGEPIRPSPMKPTVGCAASMLPLSPLVVSVAIA